MSYILDALKRAEAERGRGSVPGLHARQAAAVAPDGAAGAGSRVWLGVAAALTLGLAAAGWWVWQKPVGEVPPSPPRPGVTSRLVPTPQAGVTTPGLSVPTPQPAVLSAPAQLTATPREVPVAVVPVTKKVLALTTPAARAVAAEPSIVTAAAVPLLSELSDDIRRQIPALAVTGAVYSNNPAQRLLLVNNQVLTQGSQAAPELKLTEIGEHSSVFDFRGTRFRLAH